MQKQATDYFPSRNPYSKLLGQGQGQTHTQAYANEETEKFAGRWRSLFSELRTEPSLPPLSDKTPLHVEIGCNGGHVLIEWAQAKPEALFIGIDWKFKQIYLAAEKAKKRGLKNLLFLRARAERIEKIFAPAEIDFLYLFFPDPWPKKAQQKKRFIQTKRLASLAYLLSPTGSFEIKTDHLGYFEAIEACAGELSASWKTLALSRDLHKNHPLPSALKIPEVSLFEQLFIKKGIPIKRILLTRAYKGLHERTRGLPGLFKSL